jgi:GNAT superfamily N-acetyltransferase
MNFTKRIVAHIILISCFLSFLSFATEHFEIQLLDSGLMSNKTKICLYDDATEIGFICYMQVPFLNWYVIHTFFVHPDMRNKGYGTKLLSYTCNRLENIGAHIIYIQPGPFEMLGSISQDVPLSRDIKIKKLIAFYQRFGFVSVNKLTQICAYILYKVMEIDEDSKYLLYKKLK